MKKIKFNKSWLGFVVIGIVAYLYFILSGFPASVAYKYIITPADRAHVVKLQGLSGTVWSGTAAEAKVAAISLGKLHWDMQLLTLFTGKLGLDVEIENDSNKLIAGIATGLDGQLELDDVKGYPDPVFHAPVVWFTYSFGGSGQCGY